MEVKRDSDHNYYVIENGEKTYLPGVTSITSMVGGDKINKLNWWSANETAAYFEENLEPGETYDEIDISEMVEESRRARFVSSGRACNIGSLAHEWIEKYINNLIAGENSKPEFPENNEVCNAIESFLDWESGKDIEYKTTEEVVWNEADWYAGTLDVSAIVNGKPVIMDWKTSTGIYGTYKMQAAAYLTAKRFDKSGIKPEGFIIVRIPKDKGDFEVFECFDNDEINKHYKGFRGARMLYEWENDN